MIEKFAGYGFNKSHSTAYALIAYMTAYLKAHYPVEFMAALLSGDIAGRNFKKKDSLVEHLEDCQRMDIEVVPPDVNRSDADFTVADGKIHFGLSAIKGCGSRRPRRIVAARAARAARSATCSISANGSIRRRSTAPTIETLIKAGAFDSLGARRVADCMAVLDRALQVGRRAAADRRSGQKGLFARWTTTKPPAGGSASSARRARVGRPRAAGQGKGSARLLPLQPSAGRAREDAGHLLLAHHGRRRHAARTAPK